MLIAQGIQRHFMEILKIIKIRQNSPAALVIFQIIQHAVYLIEHALLYIDA